MISEPYEMMSRPLKSSFSFRSTQGRLIKLVHDVPIVSVSVARLIIFFSFHLSLLPSPLLHHSGRHATPLPELYVSVTSSVPAGLHPASPPSSFNPYPPTAPPGTIRYCYTHHARQLFNELRELKKVVPSSFK